MKVSIGNDNYHYIPTEYIPYEKSITIHNAPTEASVKLYSEFKQKAYDSVLETLTINDNSINLNAIIYKEYSSMQYYCSYIIKINGKEFRNKIELGNMMTTKDEVLPLIYKELSEKLVSNFLELNSSTILKGLY